MRGCTKGAYLPIGPMSTSVLRVGGGGCLLHIQGSHCSHLAPRDEAVEFSSRVGARTADSSFVTTSGEHWRFLVWVAFGSFVASRACQPHRLLSPRDDYLKC